MGDFGWPSGPELGLHAEEACVAAATCGTPDFSTPSCASPIPTRFQPIPGWGLLGGDFVTGKQPRLGVVINHDVAPRIIEDQIVSIPFACL